MACEFILTSPAVSRMSDSSNLDSYVMGGRRPYSCCFVGCYLQDLFNIVRSILLQLPSSFFFIRLVSVHIAVSTRPLLGKKMHFILSVRSDLHMTDSLSIAVHAFASHMFMSFSVDETLLPRSVNLSTSFRELPFSVEVASLIKHMYSVLYALTWRPMSAASHFRICSRVSAWASVFARSAMSSA